MEINLNVVATAIREVAAIEILPRWRNLSAGEIIEKDGPNDLVTVADRAAEKALSAKLLALYPHTHVVGEEGVEADPSVMELFKHDQPIWVIDPIDGTMAFAKGAPEFDVMLALVQGTNLLAGWIYSPVDDDMIMGDASGVIRITKTGKVLLPSLREGLGEGTSCDQVKVPAPNPSRGEGNSFVACSKSDLKSLTGILGNKLFSKEQRDYVKSKEGSFKKLHSSICAGHDYAAMLRGEAQFAIYGKCMPWDHLPGLAMLTKLGFVYCKHDGSAYVPGDTSGGLMIAQDQVSLDGIRALTMG